MKSKTRTFLKWLPLLGLLITSVVYGGVAYKESRQDEDITFVTNRGGVQTLADFKIDGATGAAVITSATFSPPLNLTETAGGTVNTITLAQEANSANKQVIRFQRYTDASPSTLVDSAAIIGNRDGGNVTGLVFQVSESSGTLYDAVQIDGAGSLTVNDGNIVARDNGDVSMLIDASASGDAHLRILTTGSGTDSSYIRFSTNNDWSVGVDDSDDHFKFRWASATVETGDLRLEINDGGNVGIPGKLAVGGDAGTASLTFHVEDPSSNGCVHNPTTNTCSEAMRIVNSGSGATDEGVLIRYQGDTGTGNQENLGLLGFLEGTSVGDGRFDLVAKSWNSASYGELLRIANNGNAFFQSNTPVSAGNIDYNIRLSNTSNNSSGAYSQSITFFGGSTNLGSIGYNGTAADRLGTSSAGQDLVMTSLNAGFNVYTGGNNTANRRIKVSSTGLVSLYLLSGQGTTMCSSGGTGALRDVGDCSSSIRFKENVESLHIDEVSKIHDLRPVKFDWTEEKGGYADYGLVAEEVAEVFPNLVNRDSEGEISGVRYRHFTSLLLAEIQRLRKEVDALKSNQDEIKTAVGF